MGERVVEHSRYRMPAEWEPHEGTWLQWPQDRVYRGYELKLEGIWLAMVRALHPHENVHLIVAGERQQDHVASQLTYFDIGLENVYFYIIPTNDVWARDNGPIFVLDPDGQVAITDWEFNGWGQRFPCDLDNLVPAAIGEQRSISVLTPGMVLEGGAVEVNDNYLVANEVVLVPVFGHAHDQRAKAIIAEQFPDREVIGIDVVGLVEHGGAIGCVTQPQPLGIA